MRAVNISILTIIIDSTASTHLTFGRVRVRIVQLVSYTDTVSSGMLTSCTKLSTTGGGSTAADVMVGTDVLGGIFTAATFSVMGVFSVPSPPRKQRVN